MKDNSPLKVWVMSAEYDPYIIGGLGTVATYLTDELVRLGIEATVITTTPSASVEVVRTKGLTLARFPKNYSALLITEFLRTNGFPPPIVVHIHSLEYAPLLKCCKHLAGIPIIYTCHSLLHRIQSRVFTPRRQAQVLRIAEQIVVPSASEYTKLLRKYPYCAGKTVVIPHGVRVGGSNSSDASKHHLLYVGRLVPRKGLEELIDAMAILKVKHLPVQLSIIGTGREAYVRELKRRANRKRVSRIVHWLGRYAHGGLQSAYGLFGAVVMPSRAESFGLVALEALAHGTPLVATQAGGLRHFVTSEVAEIIHQVDGAAIAEAITKMWLSSSTTRERVVAGRKLALNYHWSYAAQQYAKIFVAVSKRVSEVEQ